MVYESNDTIKENGELHERKSKLLHMSPLYVYLIMKITNMIISINFVLEYQGIIILEGKYYVLVKYS